MSKIWSPTYTSTDAKVLSQTAIFSNKYFKLLNCEVSFKLFNGNSVNVTRFLLHKLHAAVILLFNPIEDYIVFVEQFRIGSLNTSPWPLELVAGLIESGTPQDTAIREAKEEADCEVLEIIPICNYFSSPGIMDEETFIYCGKINTCNGGIHGLAEENEDIKVHKIKVADAFELLDSNSLHSASTIIAVQWFKLNYSNLKLNLTKHL